MRAKDFITITPNTDEVKKIAQHSIETDKQDDTESVMVPPLQQSIELQKAAVGKESDVIDDLVSDECDQNTSDQDKSELSDDELLSFIHFLKNTGLF